MQPVYMFNTNGMAATSTLDPTALEASSTAAIILSALGPLGSCTAGDLPTFMVAQPVWAIWVYDLATQGVRDLWLDPTSGAYLFTRSDFSNQMIAAGAH
jgi:hypothetical protein